MLMVFSVKKSCCHLSSVKTKNMKRIDVIPYGCSAGGQVSGSERGALDLKQNGLIERLQSSTLDIKWQYDPKEIYDTDFGKKAHENLPPLGSQERKEIVLWHCRRIQNDVLKALKKGTLPLTIGGDHAMAAGSISAVAKAKNAYGRTGVIWIDAHPDLNTPDTSISQALHGMPLAALVGMGDENYVSLTGNEPVIRYDSIVYIGIRDIDPGEQDYIDRFGITAFTMDDVNRLGIDNVLEQAKAIITKDTDAQVISIDLDGFDPEDVPAVGSPVPHGLKPETTLPALKKLMKEIDFDLIEIAEYNPMLAGRDKTRDFIEELLKTLLSD